MLIELNLPGELLRERQWTGADAQSPLSPLAVLLGRPTVLHPAARGCPSASLGWGSSGCAI